MQGPEFKLRPLPKKKVEQIGNLCSIRKKEIKVQLFKIDIKLQHYPCFLPPKVVEKI